MADRFLSPEQARQLTEMAEQAQTSLSRFAGHEVGYDSTALQLLDEWVDRHMRQFPTPSQKMRLLWTSFLGEIFRRRHDGEWILRQGASGAGTLTILCPTHNDVHAVPVSQQINRRIAQGMAESLVLFYMQESIALRAME
jgi:hypothetical protein